VATPLREPVKVAILVFCDAPLGLLPGNPNLYCPTDNTEFGFATQLTMRGVDLYVSEMVRQQPMPLSNGGNVSFEFVYINLGFIDWTAPMPDIQRVVSDFGTESAGGFAWNISMTDMYGGPFTFVVAPMFSTEPLNVVMANICEDHDACVMIHPFEPSQSMVVCTAEDAQGLALPTDCVRRHRLPGARRFLNFLGVLFDSTTVAESVLELARTQGVTSLYIVAEQSNLTHFQGDAIARTLESAAQSNISVVGILNLEFCPPGDACQTQMTYPNGSPAVGQTQIMPGGRSAGDVAREIEALLPGAVLLVSTNIGGSAHAMASLIAAFKDREFTPTTMSWAGGGDESVCPFLKDPADIAFTLKTLPWDYRLTGPSYRNLKSAVNFELFPADELSDGPAVFAREFNRRFANETVDFEQDVSAVFTVFGYHALTIAQKLIESALSADIATLVTTSYKVSVPSVYHQLRFDVTGRTERVNEMLHQYIPASGATGACASYPYDMRLLAPYNIGRPAVFPMPTWSERIYPRFAYAFDPLDIALITATSVCLLLCLCLAVPFVFFPEHHILKAATPAACLLVLLGACMMLASNYAQTWFTDDRLCSAHMFLLTTGFTLMFGSLFAKTLRIWILFVWNTNNIASVVVSDARVLGGVCVCVAADIGLNVAWQLVSPIRSSLVANDAFRPSFNVVVCDYTGGMIFFILHLAFKGVGMTAGAVLAFQLRNAPSTFRESPFIGACIYNVCLCTTVAVLLVSENVGKYRTQLIIRAAAVVLVSIPTCALLFVPRFVDFHNSITASKRGGGAAAELSRDGGDNIKRHTSGVQRIVDSDGEEGLVVASQIGDMQPQPLNVSAPLPSLLVLATHVRRNPPPLPNVLLNAPKSVSDMLCSQASYPNSFSSASHNEEKRNQRVIVLRGDDSVRRSSGGGGGGSGRPSTLAPPTPAYGQRTFLRNSTQGLAQIQTPTPAYSASSSSISRSPEPYVDPFGGSYLTPASVDRK